MNDRQVFNRVIIAVPLVIAVGFIAAMCAKAKAHTAPSGWSYPLSCCSNRDCREMDASHFVEGPEGITVTLPIGSHPMVQHWPVKFVVPYQDSKIKASPDGVWHVCISPQHPNLSGAMRGGHLLCLFQPPKGF